MDGSVRERFERLDSDDPWSTGQPLRGSLLPAPTLHPSTVSSATSEGFLRDSSLSSERPFQGKASATCHVSPTPLLSLILLPFSSSSHHRGPQTGEICLDVLKDQWTPSYTLESLCRTIIQLLSHPAADSPLNCDSGNMIRAGDLAAYHDMARMYTLDYAIPTPSYLRKLRQQQESRIAEQKEAEMMEMEGDLEDHSTSTNVMMIEEEKSAADDSSTSSSLSTSSFLEVSPLAEIDSPMSIPSPPAQ